MRGSVYKRPETGRWEYRFEAGADPLTGRRLRVAKTGFETKREASAAMRVAMAAHAGGRSVRSDRVTMAAFADQWHEAIRPSVRPSTWVNYRDYLDGYVTPVIGGTALQDLTPMRLNLLYSHLLQQGRVRGNGGLAPKTVQNVHRMLHRALRDAVKWDLVPRNVAEDASPPKSRRPQLSIWAPDQLGAFVEHVADDRFFALWLLVATTGLRRGELAGLRRHDIDFVHATVNPRVPRVVVGGRAEESETKTSSGERAMALDPTTSEALRVYVTTWDAERAALGQDTQLLFVWPHGQALHPDTITAMFRRHCEAAKLPRIRLHDVRHSYATAALKAGISPKIISERLGHASAAFTLQTYAHVLPGMDREAASSVAELILGVADSETPSAAHGHNSGHMGGTDSGGQSKEPADLLRLRRSAGSSSSSGGRI